MDTEKYLKEQMHHAERAATALELLYDVWILSDVGKDGTSIVPADLAEKIEDFWRE